jgi:hypothetical protein
MKREGAYGLKRECTPSLKLRHHLSRMITTSEQLCYRGKPQFDADEKNFMTHDFNGKVYLCSKFMTREFMDNLKTAKVQSKSNITWVMICTCIGRLIPEIGFNGALFLRRICKPHVAQKPSVNYKVGNWYDQHCTYDGPMHIQIHKELCE